MKFVSDVDLLILFARYLCGCHRHWHNVDVWLERGHLHRTVLVQSWTMLLVVQWNNVWRRRMLTGVVVMLIGVLMLFTSVLMMFICLCGNDVHRCVCDIHSCVLVMCSFLVFLFICLYIFNNRTCCYIWVVLSDLESDQLRNVKI